MVRKMRHWKQQYQKDAGFIWRKPITYAGALMKVGDRVPEDLLDRNKARRFWEARVIELADFSAPNVKTGVVEEPKVEPINLESLIGSGILPSEVVVGGVEISLGQLVIWSFEKGGLSLENWNELPQEVREETLQADLNLLNVLANVTKGKSGWWTVIHGDEELKVRGGETLATLLEELFSKASEEETNEDIGDGESSEGDNQ